MFELMTKGDPFLLNEEQESFNGSVVRIQQKLCEGSELSSSIPAITVA
jgi:hypothetical protein